MIRHIAKTSLSRLPQSIPTVPLTVSVNFKTSQCISASFQITSEEDFTDRVMLSHVPVIVNFVATWCELCPPLNEVLEKMVSKHGDNIHLAEVVIDDNALIAQAFQVTAVPAVVAIHNGTVTNKFVGITTPAKVKAFVDSAVEAAKKS